MNVDFYEDDHIFVGIDMIKTPRKMLDEKESEICKDMTENELRAYRYGLDNFAKLLESLFIQEDNEIFVYVPGVEIPEEFYYEDLIEKLQ